ncbi:hypothetical protein EZ449_22080 [Pedobacter frigidisoli]|uniref:Uncharacterized protein n=1 Tax=Pedobacter frigidisoli TaxID=2530455 RepID=A0A4R0NCU4_9SPHI|nr:hypothetical protein [Pedobacter frigidisoli]TCC96882.1 hypothetical protein EZ449_22080 [Pedobacter frigidisoli]
MKTIIYGIAILFASLGYSCQNRSGNLSLNTTDTNSAFRFEANYAEDKTAKLKKYLDSALNNELSLDQDIDLLVNLNGKDKFNLKAKQGWLQIDFDKQNSSLNGYVKLKKLTEGIQKKLVEM